MHSYYSMCIHYFISFFLSLYLYCSHSHLTLPPTSLFVKAVHESGRVGFVPNPDSTRMDLGGESLTRNQPSSSFRSCSSGRISFESISVGFEFAGMEQNLAGFWLKYCWISSDLVESNKT